MKVTFKKDYLKDFVADSEVELLKPTAGFVRDTLLARTGVGNEMEDWLTLPSDYDKEEFTRILKVADKIKSDSKVLVVIGIGGSYLGARAVIEFLKSEFHNEKANKKGLPEVYFVGTSASGRYIDDVIDLIGNRDFSINIISKSGTTTEPAIAFRTFKSLIEKKYGKEEASKRIFATTDAHKGALLNVAKENGYERFVVPDGIGGRYSVLSAVGLLPIAVAGINIQKLMDGAKAAQEEFAKDEDILNKPSILYAIYRNILYRKGFDVETIVGYEPQFRSLFEWWKQLMAESEGKDNKGIYPTSAIFSTDLHSIGQYIQDGKKILFETILDITKPISDRIVPSADDNTDNLDYILNKPMKEVNEAALTATAQAHTSAGVPNILLQLDDLDEFNLGNLIYFFEAAVAVSGYLDGINPFDQPGVEIYKTNMFKILGKPGYTD
ncbi:glucose-6-phosphate isomerase [Oenococcus oeni]|uniref:glucose-6-phosphate isomerase n=1 Tax=Oenococcus oeni TaxID=1247 RepID=UPI0004ABEEF0|nr:glucose-6-phosphate isomerase [Oenococcus oeni]KEP87719.1 glucose-6-phosphate isomerase [Oenococcus oeni IOEB_0501]OIL21125.1 glucose-6-phosphate isomerase [Oenococcus oeni]OIL26421.1 glucose-6-phosphate isomerase [Oenococcus oeni]OIL36096.1 glucose-6-phosphate isomerase [Oenococcus oeni]OIL42526.1 glucose-6-phosphate isomerase [Oenococcus oeni]